MPAITQAPTSASASASQTRQGGCSAKNDRAADHGQDRRDIADEGGVGDLRPEDGEMERADVDREGEAGERERNRCRPEVGRARRAPRPAAFAQTASAGTASPMRQAAPASGPTSRKRTRMPDQAMIAVPARRATSPTRSTAGSRGSRVSALPLMRLRYPIAARPGEPPAASHKIVIGELQ